MAAPERLTRAERQAQTRAALLDAAARVFIERGYRAAGVEAIAQEAGFTRGAFYSNFASKGELFTELLQQRVYAVYRGMVEEILDEGARPTLRQTGERLAALQADPDGRWLFRLWLELLAESGRDDDLRALASGFWSGNRALLARAVALDCDERGVEPPAPPEHIASALIALDVGLALQHYVDPDAVPLDRYPELFELLFGALRKR